MIKVGDTEVLIDAGPTQSNAAAIKEYVNEYCTDGILEYVIVTHGDADHISGMVGTSENGKYDGILYSYEIGTLIQFDRTNLKTVTDSGNPTLYGRYTTAVSYAQARRFIRRRSVGMRKTAQKRRIISTSQVRSL